MGFQPLLNSQPIVTSITVHLEVFSRNHQLWNQGEDKFNLRIFPWSIVSRRLRMLSITVLESCPRKSEDGHPEVREIACHRLQMADRAMNLNEMNYEQWTNSQSKWFFEFGRCSGVLPSHCWFFSMWISSPSKASPTSTGHHPSPNTIRYVCGTRPAPERRNHQAPISKIKIDHDRVGGMGRGESLPVWSEDIRSLWPL